MHEGITSLQKAAHARCCCTLYALSRSACVPPDFAPKPVRAWAFWMAHAYERTPNHCDDEACTHKFKTNASDPNNDSEVFPQMHGVTVAELWGRFMIFSLGLSELDNSACLGEAVR